MDYMGDYFLVHSECQKTGLMRTAEIDLPKGYWRDQKKPRTVIVVPKALGGLITRYSRFRNTFQRYANKYDYIIVYPNSLGDGWSVDYCCGQAGEQNIDNVGFIKSLIGKVISSNELIISNGKVVVLDI